MFPTKHKDANLRRKVNEFYDFKSVQQRSYEIKLRIKFQFQGLEYSSVMEHLLKMCVRPRFNSQHWKRRKRRRRRKRQGRKPMSAVRAALSNSSMRTNLPHYCVVQSTGH